MADSEETSAPTPPPPARPATLGELLRTTRLNQDLTIEQLEAYWQRVKNENTKGTKGTKDSFSNT